MQPLVLEGCEDMRLDSCTLCPRECKVNRTKGQKGYCGCDDKLYVARAALHKWEEPCISGEEGSGTVFFAGCALKCVYCQNSDISAGAVGKKITVERLAKIFTELQEKGANNINLVTPGHYILHIAEALKLAKDRGLRIPIVYNSGGYERVEALRLLEGLVDIYLPDFKYYSDELAVKYSNAKEYLRYAKSAIEEMFRQVGVPVFDERGIMKKGVMVRHLVLPHNYSDSKRIIKYLYEKYGHDIYLSIMSQYTPMKTAAIREEFPELLNKLDFSEYDKIVDYAVELGIENAFIQEEDVAEESFIPEFNCEGV